MSVIKERIFGAVTVMDEKDAAKVWDVIRFQFGFPVDLPTEEEVKILNAYKNGDDEYQPFISHAELIKELQR